jgi:hypothetical protein
MYEINLHSTAYRVDKENNLVLNESATLKGNWSLTDDHDLLFKMDAVSDSVSGKKILIRGTLKAITKNSIQFEVSKKQGSSTSNVLKLSGIWNADAYNRLVFKVKKDDDRYDKLTLHNSWIIDKDHRITYSYIQSDKVSGVEVKHDLTLKGYWAVTSQHRLYYELDKTSGSGFDFMLGAAAFEKNKIKYKINLGTDNKRGTIELRGQWLITTDTKLSFELEYEKNNIKLVTFSGVRNISDTSSLSFKFKNGLTLTLKHQFFDTRSNTFVRYSQDRETANFSFGFEFRI